MAAALGTPVVAAGLVGAIGVRGSLLVRATAEVRTPRAEQLSFILVALGYQACLNAAPFVLERTLVQAPGLVGAFVITSSYYRFASVLAGGFTTPALVRLSQAWARRDAAGFSEMLRTSVVGVAVASGVATVAAAVASPIVLPLLYGRDPDVPTSVVVGLTASTVLATTAAVAGTALMAAHRAVTAATLWLSGAVFVLAVVALDPGLGVVTSVGLVTGPAVVLVGVGVAITRAGRALGKGSSSQPDPA
jgi:O-antigen/teichoic acid export membrane protein